ncbi:MAG: dihydropteroate synthase [Chloroflexi bacterium]|nr:dihydropteroate synthase [Chloroflexota bacterium]
MIEYGRQKAKEKAVLGRKGITRCGDTEFRWGERTYVMGIVNLSPDSFSGDGITGLDAAVAQARRLVAEGADILDIGGESTRPRATPVSVDEEIRRVVPVIERLASEVPVPLSIDTYKWEVARLAVEAGARMLNDQWGLKRDPRLAELAAEKGIPIVLMSNQRDRGGYDAAVQRDTAYYSDVMAEVSASLRASLDMALRMGVPLENIIIDPGIGFGKTWRQELEVIRRLGELKQLERPILVGTSRKSFIGLVLDLPADQRVEGTAATVAIAIANGADMVRVHDVKQMVRVCRMSDAIVRAPRP